MDRRSRREWARAWIELGVREHLTFVELARRSGVHKRTVRRWSARFRSESAHRARPDREERAFVELIELADRAAPRIEVVLPGERRVLLDGSALVEALVRVLSSNGPC